MAVNKRTALIRGREYQALATYGNSDHKRMQPTPISKPACCWKEKPECRINSEEPQRIEGEIFMLRQNRLSCRRKIKRVGSLPSGPEGCPCCERSKNIQEERRFSEPVSSWKQKRQNVRK